MSKNFVPSFGDLDKLANGDKANDTLVEYDGYRRWEGDPEASMQFSLSNGQVARQGLAYVFSVGLAALHSRIVKMFVYGVDQKLLKALETAHRLHGQMTIATLCPIARDHKFTFKHVKFENSGSRMTYWIWLKKVD